MDVGALIREQRTAAGLSQRQLAEKAGTSQPAVAKIEAGKTSPTVKTVERLMEATGGRLEISAERDFGIDRTLIAQALKVSPEERLRRMTSAFNDIERMRISARQTMRPRRKHG